MTVRILDTYRTVYTNDINHLSLFVPGVGLFTYSR